MNTTLEQIEIPAAFNADAAFTLGEDPRMNTFLKKGDILLVSFDAPTAEVSRIIAYVGNTLFPAILTQREGETSALYPMNGSSPILIRNELDALILGTITGIIPAEAAPHYIEEPEELDA